MAFQGEAVGAQRVLSRIHAAIGKKFSEALFTNGAGNISPAVKEAKYLQASSADALKIFPGHITDKP